jgi:hypothetical protein
VRRPARIALCLLVLAATGCARTVYTNLHPQMPLPAAETAGDRSSPQYWRHFFVFGWVPGELEIDAQYYCNGTEHIERIETRRSFVQGLIAAVAGYYINVYSPYTGRVVCDRHVAAEAALETPDPAPNGAQTPDAAPAGP